MKKSFIKIILFMMLISSTSFSLSIPDKYPSYAYVFAEFGVDESYIYDRDFERFVLQNENKIKAFYKRSLSRGKDLLPMMKGYLMDDGLSDLFIYLSMIESGFSPAIVSPKKAVGLWQFMPATAKHYNLSVYNTFDERCDPISSTNAAINYLNKLHRQFGKWYLAAMAYNCGEGRLEKAIKKAGSDELSILVDDRDKYLPLETREYIKKILLVAMIGENMTLDFGSGQYLSTNNILQVEVFGGTKLRELAKLIEMKPSRLVALNKQFKNAIVPKKKPMYKITIPEEKMVAFYLRYELPEEKKSIKPHLISHYVALGETVESIAKLYQADMDEIIISNHLEDNNLELDSFLVIPVSKKIFDEVSK
jgi:membrane-bound lytic murein transglycosylase D